jgi:hypothetical protein
MLPGSQDTLGELNRLDDQSGEFYTLTGVAVKPFSCAMDAYGQNWVTVMFINNTRWSHMTCSAEDGT